jgi:hypothetical protein
MHTFHDSHLCMGMYTDTQTHRHTHIHTYTQELHVHTSHDSHMYMCTHTHTHTHTHILTQEHTETTEERHIHTSHDSHICVRTHTHTHTHTQHARTHTHTHTQKRPKSATFTRPMTPSTVSTFSKVVSMVALHSKCTRTLTFQKYRQLKRTRSSESEPTDFFKTERARAERRELALDCLRFGGHRQMHTRFRALLRTPRGSMGSRK